MPDTQETLPPWPCHSWSWTWGLRVTPCSLWVETTCLMGRRGPLSSTSVSSVQFHTCSLNHALRWLQGQCTALPASFSPLKTLPSLYMSNPPGFKGYIRITVQPKTSPASSPPCVFLLHFLLCPFTVCPILFISLCSELVNVFKTGVYFFWTPRCCQTL